MNINEEKDYCLNCNNKPCMTGCPLENDIPHFIKSNYDEAVETLYKTTVLPAVCGRVCSSLNQCKEKCTRGIKGEPVKISEIEAEIGDMSIKNNYKIPSYNKSNNLKVAIIGGGPAGLTAAAFLAREGTKVTIYEKRSELGGLLRYGIPEFRLEKDVVYETVKKIIEIGNIDIKYNIEFGKDIKTDELLEKNDYVLLAFGANKSKKINIEGENIKGVYGANEFLEYDYNLDLNNKTVAILGGGDVSIDIARTAKRKGAKKVYIIYRRAEEQMPAEKSEIIIAKEENVEFIFQTNIVKVVEKTQKDLASDSDIDYIECIKTELIEKEGESRLSPVNIENSNYTMKVDYLFKAIGGKVEEDIVRDFDTESNERKCVIIDSNYQTSYNRVFACGDLCGEKPKVAWAARSGREAANKILEKIKEE